MIYKYDNKDVFVEVTGDGEPHTKYSNPLPKYSRNNTKYTLLTFRASEHRKNRAKCGALRNTHD